EPVAGTRPAWVSGRRAPASPPMKTSLGPLPHTAGSHSMVPEPKSTQVEPLKWRRVPASPTMKTSLGPLPQTPRNSAPCVQPALIGDQLVPSKWRMVLPYPTAKMSLGPLPQTLPSEFMVPESTSDHWDVQSELQPS